jgi:hypothetical protein
MVPLSKILFLLQLLRQVTFFVVHFILFAVIEIFHEFSWGVTDFQRHGKVAVFFDVFLDGTQSVVGTAIFFTVGEVANAVFRACETIGYPEAQINLAHGAAYLAQCKKSRKSYDAYFEALADVEKLGNLAIPLAIRNAPTKLMKELEYGKDYEMYDDKSYLPEKLKGKKYLK